MTGNPLLYLSVTLVIVSMQFLLMGLMTELLTRTYHESQDRKTYAIRAVHEPGGPPDDGRQQGRASDGTPECAS